LDIT
jgi:1-deoxy-D-xylulose-5-phosphate reductoisomerase